jgi:hypothetical protein
MIPTPRRADLDVEIELTPGDSSNSAVVGVMPVDLDLGTDAMLTISADAVISRDRFPVLLAVLLEKAHAAWGLSN